MSVVLWLRNQDSLQRGLRRTTLGPWPCIACIGSPKPGLASKRIATNNSQCLGGRLDVSETRTRFKEDCDTWRLQALGGVELSLRNQDSLQRGLRQSPCFIVVQFADDSETRTRFKEDCDTVSQLPLRSGGLPPKPGLASKRIATPERLITFDELFNVFSETRTRFKEDCDALYELADLGPAAATPKPGLASKRIATLTVRPCVARGGVSETRTRFKEDCDFPPGSVPGGERNFLSPKPGLASKRIATLLFQPAAQHPSAPKPGLASKRIATLDGVGESVKDAVLRNQDSLQRGLRPTTLPPAPTR